MLPVGLVITRYTRRYPAQTQVNGELAYWHILRTAGILLGRTGFNHRPVLTTGSILPWRMRIPKCTRCGCGYAPWFDGFGP